MYLYELINQRYGTKSNRDRYNKQKEVYERLGSPMGAYRGSLEQNTYLLNNQNRWDSGAANQAPAQSSSPAGGGAAAAGDGYKSLAQQAADAVLPDQINTPTSFSELLPIDKIINEQTLKDFAYSRVDPEVGRLKTDAVRGLGNQLSSSGAWMTGFAGAQNQKLDDQYSRLREEMADPFYQEGKNKMTDYYNELEQEYYKDPNSFDFSAIDPSLNKNGTSRITGEMDSRAQALKDKMEGRFGEFTPSPWKTTTDGLARPSWGLEDRIRTNGSVNVNPIGPGAIRPNTQIVMNKLGPGGQAPNASLGNQWGLQGALKTRADGFQKMKANGFQNPFEQSGALQNSLIQRPNQWNKGLGLSRVLTN